MIYTNDKNFGGQFQDAVSKNVKSSENIDIASGYFGSDVIKYYQKDFVKVAKTGRVRILIGMVFHQGLRKKQYETLQSLNTELQSVNPASGVFITRRQYHGKVYLFDTSVFVGSSNFSTEGLSKRLECTTKIDDPVQKKPIKDYVDFLFSAEFTQRLEKVDLLRKKPEVKPESKLESYLVDSIPFNAVQGECCIKLRVDNQPRSSLNLYFDKGRVIRSSGLYAPRPWYEIEITSSKDDRKNYYYPKSILKSKKSKSRIGYFNAYIKDNGLIYCIKMFVGSDSGKAIASSKDSGGRATLGRILKGKLEQAKCLKKGDLITSDILADYGKDSIILRKFDDDNYEIVF
jgi:hypothetical protein